MTDRAADAGAIISASAASWAWIVHANELASLVASIIAALSGLAAITYYVIKAREK